MHQVFVLHYLGTDETLLEVSVDDPRSLRRLGVLPDGPASDLISARSEEIDQVKGIVASLDNFWNHSPLVGIFVVKFVSFVLSTVRNEIPRAISIDIIFDLLQPLVFLSNIIIGAKIDQINNLLGSDESVGI